MNFGKRLLELRMAKNLSQGDIAKRTGFLRNYMSRLENGHISPSTDTLERLAKALQIEVYQIFFEGEGKPQTIAADVTKVLNREKQLVALFHQLREPDKQLILHVARDLAKRRGRRNRA